MFSSITIASSTTNPNDRINAISDMLLRLKFISRMTTNVPRIENGNASAGNQRRRRVLQEQVDDEDDEDERRRHRDLDVLERGANRERAVGALDQMNRRRQLGC